MKFLLVGHGGFYNRGCEAIVRTTVMMLRHKFNHSNIILSSFDSQNDKLANIGYDVKIIPAQLNGVWRRWTGNWMLRQICKLYSKEKSLEILHLPIISAMRKSDIILSVGGDNFSMAFGLPPEYFLKLNKMAKKKKKKLVIWAASIGPFPNDKKLIEIVNNLKLADLITVRESATMNYLKQIGITANVKRVADPAFLLPTEKIPIKEMFPDNFKDIIGINISHLLGLYRNGGEDYIIKEVVSFVRRIINEKGLYVLLIPHVTKHIGPNNDYFFMQKIYEKLNDNKMITIIPGIYNAMQMKYIISICRFFIGARTHATIAALSNGVPTISIGYSLKSKGINQDIFGNQDYLLKVDELTAKSLFDKFIILSMRELEIRKILSKRIPQMKKMAWANIEYLNEIL